MVSDEDVTTDIDTVLLLDLRDMDAAAASARLAAAVADYRRHGEGVAAALVLDRASDLLGHQRIYEEILNSHWVEHVLCVAVGAPRDRAAGLVLDRSLFMNPPHGATLWVSDEEGVGWRMEPPGPAVPYRDGGPGLDGLIEVLRVPEVYARVLLAAGEVPDAVASPGLRLVTDDAGDHLLAWARLAAIARLTDSREPSAVNLSTALGGLAIYTGYTGKESGRYAGGSPFREDGRLHQLDALCRTRIADAEESARRLGGFAGVFGARRESRHAVGRVAAVRDALATYRTALEAAFHSVDGGSGLDRAAREELARLGVALTGTRPDDVIDHLRAATEEALADRTPLPAFADRLREFAQRATPTGSAAQRERLAPACPRQLLERLGDPPAAPLSLFSPALLPAAPLVGFLTALGGSPFLGAVAAVVWTLLVWLLWARAPVLGGERGFRGRGWAGVLPHLLLAATGTAAGTALLSVVSLPDPVRWSALGCALAVTMVEPALWWRRAVTGWRDRIGLGDAERARARLTEVAADVAEAEWVLGDARRIASDMATTLANVIDRCASTLREHARELRAGGAPGGTAGGTAGHGHAGGALEAVAEDLVHAVHAVLASVWPRLTETAFQGLADRSAVRLDGLLRDYDEHLARWGVQQTPPFSPGGRKDRGVVLQIRWTRPAEAQDALRTEVGDLMLQLCEPQDLPLLRSSAQAARLVRFAPISLKHTEDGGYGLESISGVVWTRTGHLAGALRLVPPRAGTVRAVWSTNGDGGS